MDSTQVWTVIGIFAGMIPAIYLMLRDMRKSIISEVDERPAARFDAVDAIEHRLDGVEGDLSIIKAALIRKPVSEVS